MIDFNLSHEFADAVAERAGLADVQNVAGRIWEKDPTLWGGDASTPELSDRLGWLTVADALAEQAGELHEFAHAAAADGLTDAVLLGMGGSSLAPEVFRRSFETARGHLRLHVLDSTDADAVLAVDGAIDPAKTLFVVSSKSGGTLEPNSMFAHFWAKVGRGDQFCAVTDPGSSLEALGAQHGFRRVFLADPDIGGRYSAMTHFGMVPAALMGAPVDSLLAGARAAAQSSRGSDASPAANPALWLGVALGELARRGRDKLTFVVADDIASFGLWGEQLVAESTGKHGTGILPVAGEPLGDPAVYGDDRVFLAIGDVDGERLDALGAAGHPVIRLASSGPEDLGRIMFLSEFATAVAGWALEINPFDQPNVQEAKDNTSRVLEQGAEEPADGDPRFVLDAAPPNYVAIMGYVAPSDAFDEALTELRVLIRLKTRATTTFGYGPRFLHSTGQFHKGGPKEGLFLQLVHDGDSDVEIPGKPFTFTQLKNAQATGDLQTLRSHGLRAERVRLQGDPVGAVRDLTERMR